MSWRQQVLCCSSIGASLQAAAQAQPLPCSQQLPQSAAHAVLSEADRHLHSNGKGPTGRESLPSASMRTEFLWHLQHVKCTGPWLIDSGALDFSRPLRQAAFPVSDGSAYSPMLT
ncbi:hypothetical protein WJX73_005885 [Symbiochloris irregularis]|uniref:Uncharacterized protein n=1 Tax=Symbiochloris irregularis TaxID=706552 RepID=A0AAW1PZL6_9CHLO